MKVVFFGTSSFAVPALEKIHRSGLSLLAVVTAPDKRGGRGRKQLIESPVKKYATAHKIPVLQPVSLKANEFIQDLKSLKADIFVVVAFRMLPEVVWNMPERGTVNLHASLLPRLRGAAPIHHAVISGAKKTGLTVFQLAHKIDTGAIIRQEEVEIGADETTGELHDKMAGIGSLVLLQALYDIESDQVEYRPQNDEMATSAPKIYKEMGRIDWKKEVRSIHNLIRGLNPFPGAYTNINGMEFKIWRANIVEKLNSGKVPGTMETDGKSFLKIYGLDGYLDCIEVQLSGKKRMEIKEFLNGWGKNLPLRVEGN